ncbi:hypothetical protein FOL47_008137 [Perkinsus chesapeaki]|uniref:Uncharacterized protein n=1 Tax=Perkinsus chesapeaki TaxID=330153 RepID=A0A7J6LH27_PERCH|nr:hypothetical protein FOL47_008137 [Perkinsus chesapeaki]
MDNSGINKHIPSPADAPTRAATPFNIEAKVFVPNNRDSKLLTTSSSSITTFNPDAPEFVPIGGMVGKSSIDYNTSLIEELLEVILSDKYNNIRKWLVLEGNKDLSDIIDELKLKVNIMDSEDSIVHEEYMNNTDEGGDMLSTPPPPPPLKLGRYADKMLVDRIYEEHSDELQIFKNMIVVVVKEFCRRNVMTKTLRDTQQGGGGGGLALSLFAAEWDKYYQGSHNLKCLRERFGVIKLMPFLRTIEELDLIGNHPEVRVRVKREYMMDNNTTFGSNNTLIQTAAATGGRGGGLGYLGNKSIISNIGAATAAVVPPVSLDGGSMANTTTTAAAAAAAATAFVTQQLLYNQQQLIKLLGRNNTILNNTRDMYHNAYGIHPPLDDDNHHHRNGMESLLSDLLSTSSPDLGHVKEVVEQLEGLSIDSINDDRKSWLSRSAFKKLIIKVIREVCNKQDREWSQSNEQQGQCSSLSKGDDRDDSQGLLLPQRLVKGRNEPVVGSDDDAATVQCNPRESKDDLCYELKRLLMELVWKKCQEQRLRCLEDGARIGVERYRAALNSLIEENNRINNALYDDDGDDDEEKENVASRGNPSLLLMVPRRETEGVSSAATISRQQAKRPTPIDTSRSPEKKIQGETDHALEILFLEAEGLLIDDLKKEWYEAYNRQLQPLLDMSGLRKVLTLAQSCGGGGCSYSQSFTIVGFGSTMRCMVKLMRPPPPSLTSLSTNKNICLPPPTIYQQQPSSSTTGPVIIDNRPSIVTPDTVPLPTPGRRRPSTPIRSGDDEGVESGSNIEGKDAMENGLLVESCSAGGGGGGGGVLYCDGLPALLPGANDADEDRLNMERLLKQLLFMNGQQQQQQQLYKVNNSIGGNGVDEEYDNLVGEQVEEVDEDDIDISDGSLAVNIDRVATEQIKKATTTPKPKGASGISTISNHGPPQAAAPPPTTPQSAPKRRRVSAKAKAAAGGDVKNGKGGTDMSTSGVIAVKTKGVQVGTQLQDINGEVSLLSKPKNPVMTPPLRWQSSHQMPPHSLEDAFEVWSFCCNYSESLLDIKPVTAGEYADALFARGLAPLMQEIHLALLRIVIPHVAYLSCSHASDGDSNNSIDATTRHEMTEAAKWFNRVEYKDIPPRVRITVLKALLQSCEVSPLFVRYQSCVSAALAKAKVSMGRLARIENESMQKETEIGRSILIEGIESRRRELKEMESRLRALNMWAKFGTTNIETDEEEEDKIEDIKDETESGGDMSPVLSSLGRESSITTTAMVPLCSDNIKKELGIWGNRRRIVTAVRQQATRALLRVAPDEIPGKQPTSAGLDRSGNSYFIIPQANTTSPSICVRYSDGGLGFYQTEADVEGLVSSLDKEPSRQEGKLRRHILEATAKDLNIRQSYPPDLRTTEGLTSISSASELNNIIQALRKEANRLLELTVKVKPIAEVSDSYLSLKAAAVKPSLELPNTLTVEGLLSTEAALGEKVEWVSQEERNAFLSVLKSNTSEEKELIMTNGGSGWWSGYENGCGLMDGQIDRVKHGILLLIICGTVDALLDFWCVFLFSLVQQRIVRDLKRDLFASLLSQPLTFFDANNSGELMSRLTSDTGLLTTCIVPFNSVLSVYYGIWMQKNAAEVQDTLAIANSNANEVLGSVRTVKAFNSEENEYQRFTDNLQDYYKLQVKQAIVRSGYYMVISTFLMNMVGQAAVLGYGGWLCVEGFMAVERVRGAGASTRVFNILDRRQPFCHITAARHSSSDEDHRNGELAARRWRGEIKLKNVSFVYPSRPSSFVLRNLSFTAPGGECTFLVGESGAGKSTIFLLLQRLYQCPSGRIFIDDIDVNTIPTALLRRKLLGLVGQEPVLFRGSIRYNVLYGVDNGGIDDGDNGNHRLQHALRIGHCMGFVSQLPGGVDCEVGERAVQLSGGQKQRIAIARAIAMDPRILLLDEATSALDSENERQVQAALDEAMIGRTTLSITHRVISAARLATNVVVLDKGRVIETGDPAELLKDKKSAFKILLDRQQCLSS